MTKFFYFLPFIFFNLNLNSVDREKELSVAQEFIKASSAFNDIAERIIVLIRTCIKAYEKKKYYTFIELLNVAENLALKHRIYYNLVNIRYNLALAYWELYFRVDQNIINIQKSYHYYLEVYEQNEQPNKKAQAAYRLAYIDYKKLLGESDIDEIIFKFKFFLESNESNKYNNLKINVYGYLGYLYWQKKDYEQSLKYYKLHSIYEKKPNIYECVADNYAKLGNYPKAIEYYLLAFKDSAIERKKEILKTICKLYISTNNLFKCFQFLHDIFNEEHLIIIDDVADELYGLCKIAHSKDPRRYKKKIIYSFSLLS